MNIKRTIDKNYMLIGYIALIIIFGLFIIKALNAYFEQDEAKKLEELEANKNQTNIEASQNPETTPDYYEIESNSIEKTMRSFVKYCNNREIENAYKMLTEDCKNAMFPTQEDFERIYINNIYNIEREYELVKWYTEGNMYIYQATLYGNILATGNTNNYTQEYYTFIQDDKGNYKLNVNNYIYGTNRNKQKTVNNITVKIGHVDVYEEYEEAEINITNNSSKTISLTGNKYVKNIYLKNSGETTYSSLDSKFDKEEIVMQPGSTRNFIVKFNKVYNSKNKARYLVLSDVILDYETYLQSEDKNNYSNRTSIKVDY